VVIVGAAALATAIVRSSVDDSVARSVAWRTKASVPGTVGVPEIVPVDVSRLSPAGSAPAFTVHTKGCPPPVADTVVLYGVPTVAPGSNVVVMTGATDFTTSIPRWAVAAFELASVTFTVNEDVPGAVGVPDIAPVEGSRARPVGSDPLVTDHVKGAVPPVSPMTVE
jgi:hypothetical protein